MPSKSQLRKNSKLKGRSRRPNSSIALQQGLGFGEAVPCPDSASSLLILGLPHGVRPGKLRRALRESLAPYGMKKLRVASTHTGHSRGYAVVDLDRSESALDDCASRGGLEVNMVQKAFDVCEQDCNPIDKAESIFNIQLSQCCGGRIDSLFPFVPTSIRRLIQLDSEALFSTMDQALGLHLVAALKSLCITAGANTAQLGALDACGCCGGSALMLHGAFGGLVRAVEIDPARAKLLSSNLSLFCPDGRAQCVEGDFCELWPRLSPGMGMIFLDVPWGGPSYGESAIIEELELGGVPLVQLIARLVEAEAAPLLALRLPRNMDVDKMMRDLTDIWSSWNFRWDPVLQQPERPMPFRFELGNCGLVLMICLCSRDLKNRLNNNDALIASVDEQTYRFLREGFHLSQLDDLVLALQNWDGEKGHRHHVAFFDWEVSRWISISRWKGCKAGLREVSTEAKVPKLLEEFANDELAQALYFYERHLFPFGC